MNKQQTVKWITVFLLTLLCGICVGLLLPCGHPPQEAMVENAKAPLQNAPQPMAAAVFAQSGATLASSTPNPTFSTESKQLSADESKNENLFAIELIPSQSLAPATLTPPAATAVSSVSPAPALGDFRIEFIGSNAVGTGKRVFIYHTHTYEAYEQVKEDPYRSTQQWRTEDNEHNVVRVGKELSQILRSMGIEVVHDTTAYEPPNLSSAYTRSLAMLERRRTAGEKYDLYIDLHRDAFSGKKLDTNTVTLGGVEVAKLMLLIGKGEGQTSLGFDERPDWQSNLKIAQAMTDALCAQADGLCKEVRLKSGRFNQHISVGCLLVEVGNNRNTLAQALAAMPYLADTIAEVLK
ncbi:MAG: stage II sporulation protein P [Clostridia bacterium]